MAYAPQSVGCGQAGGRTSDDEEVKCEGSLVGFARGCRGHRWGGDVGVWGELATADVNIYIMFGDCDEEDICPGCSPCQVNRIGKIDGRKFSDFVRNNDSGLVAEGDVIFDRKCPEPMARFVTRAWREPLVPTDVEAVYLTLPTHVFCTQRMSFAVF